MQQLEKDKIIVFHLKTKWFNKIKNGEKTHEYRAAAKYKKKTFENKTHIRFDLGYCGLNEKSKHIYARLISTKLTYSDRIGMTSEELSDIGLKMYVPVWDIKFEVLQVD